jgi:pantoate--beta-alanine ligase
MTPAIVRTIADLRDAVGEWESFALVPTMGALHEGHLTLVREGLAHAPHTVVTIFVNPTQFAANEDLSRYPRDEEGDLAKLESAGASRVFAPSPEEMYPAGFATAVSLEGPAKAALEDKFRPHFFGAVATVCAKLFNQSGADFAMFGEKDYQQLQVVRRMARDLDIPIDVVGVPTVREPDGLAMSSRNRYLSKPERTQAASLHRTLQQAAEKIRAGGDLQLATRAAARSLTTLGFKVDYVAVRNAESLALPQSREEPLRILGAAWLGKTRLIDNLAA